MANIVASSIHIGREINWGDTIVDKKVKMQINFNKFHAGPEFLWDNTGLQSIKVLQIDCNKDSFISPLGPLWAVPCTQAWDITRDYIIRANIANFVFILISVVEKFVEWKWMKIMRSFCAIWVNLVFMVAKLISFVEKCFEWKWMGMTLLGLLRLLVVKFR